MDVEKVETVVKSLAAGNGDMVLLLNRIYNDGREVIDQIPNGQETLFARRMIHVASCLVHRRIKYEELVLRNKNYWQTPEGRLSAKRVREFVEERGIKG